MFDWKPFITKNNKEPRRRGRLFPAAMGPGPAAALALASLLSGCHIGPRYNPPPPPAATAPNYKESTVNFQDQEGWKVANPQDTMIRGKW